MKKRFACLMLALVMLIGLIPAAAVSASAEDTVVSEAGIRVIKESVGFHAKAYEVSTGVYKIGYGTPGTKGQTITEANADILLREELKKCASAVSTKFDSFLLVQKRRDALVWMTYLEGGSTDWANKLVAILATGSSSDIANAICTFDMDKFAGDTAAYNTLTRRMAIANLFLNGTYSATNTGTVGYTVFYAGDDNAATFGSAGWKYQVQAFSGSFNKITANTPTFAGNTFLGWYSGNSLVTGVGSATSGKVLTARWQKNGTDMVAASYTLPAYVIYEARSLADTDILTVHSEPQDTAAKIDEVSRDATVTVSAEKMVGNSKWIQLSTGGWVKLCDNVANMPVIIPTTAVTITDDYVNVRKQPDATAAKVGTLKRNEQVSIAMLSADGKWGYCSKGWIFLAYTSYDKKASSSDSTLTGGVPGTVTGAAQVNVRSAPGVSSTLVTRLNEGTAVTVYEQTTVNNAAWGHIDQGWISMGYVKLAESTTPGGNISSGSSAVVSSSVNLNVRSGPGTGYTKVATLAPGTSVVILRKEVVGGVAWGLIDQGWINLNYVTGTASSSGSTGYGVGGTVVNCSTGVNIRSAAGTTNALVGVAALGSRVTVTERVMVNGFYWGHIDRGWVCMDYIKLDSEFVDPSTDGKGDNSELDNVVSSFQGYPATVTGSTAFDGTSDGTKLYTSASFHASFLMKLNANTEVSITAFTTVDNHTFGKVAIGSQTGWLNLDDVRMKAFNAKVTAAKADAYEAPSTRSKFFASLTKGTYVTVGNDGAAFGDFWKISDGVLWGKISLATNTAWIKLSDVTMFKENVLPTGITSLSGVGYMTGSLTGAAVVYNDSNGNVTDTPSAYTLPAGSTVNVLARNLKNNVTYAKVSVGSVTGWIEWDLIKLDSVTMKASAQTSAYSTASTGAAVGTVYAGDLVTIQARQLVSYGNEINHGVIDMGQGYINDDRMTLYWFVLDDGKLVPTTEATSDDPGNPAIATSVVVTGIAGTNGVKVYEEVTTASKQLLTISSGNYVTILNWRNVDGKTWGKVQVNKIVGWVDVSEVSFQNLKGIVKVEQLNVYNLPDKTSSVQVLRVNNYPITITEVSFDGTTVWGAVNVASKNGYIDLANVTLNTIKEATVESVIAKAKVNSVNNTVNVTDDDTGVSRDITLLAKDLEVSLYDVTIKTEGSSRVTYWKAQLGDYVGWIKMSLLRMYNTVATVNTASAPIYDDLTLTKEIYTMYRGEQVTVIGYRLNDQVSSADGRYCALFGEVVCGNSTGWIQLTDNTGELVVNLAPGSTGTTIDPANPTTPTNPTNPTTPAEEGTAAYIVCSTTVNIRSGAGVDKSLVTTLPNGTNVKIYEKAVVLGKEWARIDQGWVCMDYVRIGTLATNVPGAGNSGNSGSVSIVTTVPSGAIAVGFANQDIKVRSGSGLGYPEVGTVKKNSSVVIYESKLDGGMSWGRTDNGWVCVSYLTITGIGAAGSGTTGTVSTGGFTANVRGSSSSNGALMAKVMVSSKVVVRETVAVGSETWVRTDLGWINGQYVALDSTTAPTTPTTPGTSGSTTVTEPTSAESDGFVG